ncbi:MAG: hypothetical protein HY904_21395 [Deltaproteobacteria bacterium]|nr:hypothetical protein [Deltaproteobacteria bacterium]
MSERIHYPLNEAMAQAWFFVRYGHCPPLMPIPDQHAGAAQGRRREEAWAAVDAIREQLGVVTERLDSRAAVVPAQAASRRRVNPASVALKQLSDALVNLEAAMPPRPLPAHGRARRRGDKDTDRQARRRFLSIMQWEWQVAKEMENNNWIKLTVKSCSSNHHGNDCV